MNPQPDPLAIDLLLTEDQRRPLSVASHHEWRESLAAPARDFDTIDALVAELRETQQEGEP
jgi:hypothetical protein